MTFRTKIGGVLHRALTLISIEECDFQRMLVVAHHTTYGFPVPGTNRIPFVDVFLTGYGEDRFTVEASFRVLVGELNPQGRLPVELPDQYPKGHGLSYN